MVMVGQKLINYMAWDKQTVLSKRNNTVDALIISHQIFVRMLL